MLDYLRNNPLLAGCLGFMGCSALVVLFVVGVAGLGLQKVFSSNQLAVLDAHSAAISAGYSFGYVSDNGVVSLDLLPTEPREVSCEELWTLIAPHILQPEKPLLLRSQTAVFSADLGVTVIPLECSRVAAVEPLQEPPDGGLSEPIPEEAVDIPAP